MINSNLRDIIRLSESDLTEIPIFKYKHDNRIDGIVRGISLELFMDRYDISNSSVIVEALKEHYEDQLDDIITITKDDFITESDYKPIYDILYLCEYINTSEIEDASKGINKIKEGLDKFVANIRKQDFDNSMELQLVITKCDKVLEDLEEEKRYATSVKNNSDKFKASYFTNILGRLFLVIPALIAGNPIGAAANVVGFVVGGGLEDVKNLYISYKDYDKLLDNYIDKVSRVRDSCNAKLMEIETNKALKEKNQNESLP